MLFIYRELKNYIGDAKTMVSIWSVVASVLVSMFSVLILVVVATKKVIVPTLLAVFDEKYASAEKAISSGMKALGDKGVDAKKAKKLEKAVFGDILDNYPEILIILDQVSPDTAEMIRDNPLMAAKMWARWGPTIQQILPTLNVKKGEQSITWTF